MAGSQRLLAVALAILFLNGPGGLKPDVLGVVVAASGARLGANAVSDGASVFDGDRIATETGGTLRLRGGRSLLLVTAESRVTLRRRGDESNAGTGNFGAELLAGGVVLSSAVRASAVIEALGATVLPEAEEASIVRVQTVGSHELLVSVRQGAVRVAYKDEVERIGEGEAYRVVLDDADNKDPKSAGKAKRRKITLIAVGVGIGVGAGVAGYFAARGGGGQVESPDRP